MPIVDLSSSEALANLRVRSARWPDGRTGQLDTVVKPAIAPSFSISKSDRIFTMGSCFARNLEMRLADLGFDVPLMGSRFDLDGPTPLDSAVMNKYTVHSMANEIAWAVGERGERRNREGKLIPLEELLVQLDEATWEDPHLHMEAPPAAFDQIKRRREETERLTSEVKNCGVFIFTLGLAESWFDTQTGLHLNRVPPTPNMRKAPDRYRLQVLGHDEIVEELEFIYAMLERHAPPGFRVLITVSPIPFKCTFTGQDALTANTYGKSAQRAAAEVFAGRHANVDYFPSYEIVTLSDREAVREVDNIHVTANTVDMIMDYVVSAYAPEIDLADASPRAPAGKRRLAWNEQTLFAKGLYRDGDYGKAAVALSGVLGLYRQQLPRDHLEKTVLALVWALIKTGQSQLAQSTLDELDAALVAGEFAYKIGLQYKELGLHDQARAAFEKARASGFKVPHLDRRAQQPAATLVAEGLQAGQ
jgi:hypothetical protein